MENYIYKKTKSILNELREINIHLENNKTLNLVRDLKQTGRTGKLVRIKKYSLKLPCQSIYSHLLIMAHNADILTTLTEKKLDNKAKDLIAKDIAFHDIAESIIGDIPMFTNKDLAEKHFKSIKQKKIEEKGANKIIADNLNGNLRDDFIKTIKRLEGENNFNKIFFNFIDRSEPIIAIWKYIFLFKSQISIDHFLKAMEDFFLPQNAIPYCFNKKTKKLITFLQNKKNAYKYYENGSIIFKQLGGEVIKEANLKNLIEQERLQFIK